MFKGREYWKNQRIIETDTRQKTFSDFKSEIYKDLEIQTWTNDDKPSLSIYKGKSGKPTSRYYYNTIGSRDSEINYQKKYADDRETWKNNAKEAQKNIKNLFRKGEILVSSWGYEQTNIDFYEIVGLTAKSIKIVKIGQTRTNEETGSDMSEYVVPDKKNRGTNIMTKRVNGRTDRPYVSINSFAIASRWDGNSVFQSHWH